MAEEQLVGTNSYISYDGNARFYLRTGEYRVAIGVGVMLGMVEFCRKTLPEEFEDGKAEHGAAT